jgi:hypothetical protein
MTWSELLRTVAGPLDLKKTPRKQKVLLFPMFFLFFRLDVFAGWRKEVEI